MFSDALLWVLASVLTFVFLLGLMFALLSAAWNVTVWLVSNPLFWLLIALGAWMLAFDRKDRSHYDLDPQFISVCKRTPGCLGYLREMDKKMDTYTPSDRWESAPTTSRSSDQEI
jgi:hypothetical protein